MTNSSCNPCILWSCVARNDVILAESKASDDLNYYQHHESFDDMAVNQASHELLAKKATPGWEFHTVGKRTSLRKNSPAPLKAIKFHIYDHAASGDFQIWVVACVYQFSSQSQSSGMETLQIQSFIDKMVGITEIFREHDATWKTGGFHAAQASMGPILLQRMQEVSYLGKQAMVQEQIDSLKEIMSRNIELILQRGEKIEDLQEKSTQLQEMAGVFKKTSKDVKRRMLWHNAKHGLLLGTAISAGVAVVVVPPLVAIL